MPIRFKLFITIQIVSRSKYFALNLSAVGSISNKETEVFFK